MDKINGKLQQEEHQYEDCGEKRIPSISAENHLKKMKGKQYFFRNL